MGSIKSEFKNQDQKIGAGIETKISNSLKLIKYDQNKDNPAGQDIIISEYSNDTEAA